MPLVDHGEGKQRPPEHGADPDQRTRQYDNAPDGNHQRRCFGRGAKDIDSRVTVATSSTAHHPADQWHQIARVQEMSALRAGGTPDYDWPALWQSRRNDAKEASDKGSGDQQEHHLSGGNRHNGLSLTGRPLPVRSFGRQHQSHGSLNSFEAAAAIVQARAPA